MRIRGRIRPLLKHVVLVVSKVEIATPHGAIEGNDSSGLNVPPISLSNVPEASKEKIVYLCT